MAEVDQPGGLEVGSLMARESSYDITDFLPPEPSSRRGYVASAQVKYLPPEVRWLVVSATPVSNGAWSDRDLCSPVAMTRPGR